MKQTENYGFEKPDIKEFFKLETWKNNMDKIDEAIKERETAQEVTDEEIKKIKNVQFTQADERKNIESKETLQVLFGKIARWIADLKKVAFTGSYNDLENKPDIPAAVAVKGNAEKNYRTGNVNLTPDDIGALPIGGDTAENITTFSTTSARENLKSGEKHSILFGKIAKWFADLKTVAFSGNYNDLNNKPTIPTVVNNNTTTEAGYALDARQANPNVDGSLAKQISTLNSGLKNKHYIRIEKSDWSGTLGDFIPLQDSTEKVINLIAHNELDDTYPAVRVGRADADHDGNDIPTTYLKKADAKTMFNTGYRQVSSNEFDKYFSDTWSYAGADGLSIDSGTWLVNYYCWVSESSAVDVISLKSTVDQAIGITAPNNGNGGTWLTMHEIISGKAVNNLKFLIKVPKAVTFGQISTKITAIKLC